MPFSPAVRQEALLRSKRHCCVFQEFAGRAVNVHHIDPESEGGSSEIDNAIVLCLRCHSEAGHYNDAHPIGNKYRPDELRAHRDAWWKWCADNPAVMPPKSPIGVAPRVVDVLPGKWTRKTVVTVHNRWDAPLFEIWVKASIRGPTSLDESIEIAPTVAKGAISATCAYLTVSGSVLALYGSDAAGTRAQLLRIYGLGPGESIALNVIDTSRASGNGERGQIEFSILDFGDTPPALLEQEDKQTLALLFTAPEPFTIERVGFHVVSVGD